MKNFIYYSVLIVLWATILVLLGIVLLVIGGIEAPYYALVIAILLIFVAPNTFVNVLTAAVGA